MKTFEDIKEDVLNPEVYFELASKYSEVVISPMVINPDTCEAIYRLLVRENGVLRKQEGFLISKKGIS